MSNCDRKSSNGTIEQMIGNMTSDLQNADGQFIQLGFTPPATPVQGGVPWNQQEYLAHFTSNPEAKIGYTQPQYNNQQAFGYMQQPHLFSNPPEMYDVRNTYQNTPDVGMMFPEQVLILPNSNVTENVDCSHNVYQSAPNRTQLIENLVGHWAVPNNTGTYSPFGSAQFVPNIGIFEPPKAETICNGVNHTQENFPPNDEVPFQFNRDHRKPRVVAEVKPMRPSYSDVLTKTPPQTVLKNSKVDGKEVKQKKDGKKGTKNVKTVKPNSILNRSNTNGDFKDIASDKNIQFKNAEKCPKTGKPNQLNRKWVSLDNVNESSEDLKEELPKTKKNDDASNASNGVIKNRKKTSMKSSIDSADTESANGKTEPTGVSKISTRRCFFRGTKQKNYESLSSSERPPGKRGQRIKKRECHVPFGMVRQKLKQYTRGWWKLFVYFIFWLVHLVCDICSMSVHLSHDMLFIFWNWLVKNWSTFLTTSALLCQKFRCLTWLYDKLRRKKEPEEPKSFFQAGLQNNINMPTTGEEAMKRLLACKGKDPYSILGVAPSCTDDDIKRYYKRQAFLVHPDKNNQPGAEEAFKILVHAFDMIGEPERRAAYDRGVAESVQVEQAWSELTELLAQLQQKMEAAANTIRCSSCNLRHKRIKTDRPSYAARNCATCKIHHAAREGDIWAEARCFGFLWHYYACMDGGVYDITEWAGCQKSSLKHLRPDSHHVQYRIALGKQQGNGRRHSATPRGERPPDLENLLNSLYGQQDGMQTNNAKRKNKKNK